MAALTNGNADLAAIGIAGLFVLATATCAWVLERRSHIEAEERLRQLADAAQQGIAITREGRIVEANAAFLALTGRKWRGALIGQELPGTLLRLRDVVRENGDTSLRQGLVQQPDGAGLEVEVTVREEAPAPGMRLFTLSDLRERRESERRILHLAMHDALTGLPNRTSFAQRLEQVLRQRAHQETPQPMALLHIGLDRFKAINALHGYAGGDALLRGLGTRLSQDMPPQAFTARLGGDEFGVLLPFGHASEVPDLILKLEKALAVPSYIAGEEVSVTAAIGVALYPTDSREAEGLRGQADFALRRAKGTPGRGVHFYEAELDGAQRLRLRMADEMRTALHEDQFRLFGQIQIDVRTGEPCGHEMLLRWEHPERGMVPPGEFIPMAEENGLILPIGSWALREACHLAVASPWLGKVAVNLSAVQFSQSDLPRQVAAALSESQLPPERLELEITESTLMQDTQRTLRLLRDIKAMGVRIAMDDFGTGYSSLATLRAFPFDKIKLDRKFLVEAEDSAAAITILRAVMAIGRGLGIPVLAEGVETKAQLALLHAEGCDEAQGFLFGRPRPVPPHNRASVPG